MSNIQNINKLNNINNSKIQFKSYLYKFISLKQLSIPHTE